MTLQPTIEELEPIGTRAYGYVLDELESYLKERQLVLTPGDVRSLINDVRLHFRVSELEALPPGLQHAWQDTMGKPMNEKCYGTKNLIGSIERAARADMLL